ncbi:MAG: DUF1844 domain-containing protein [bacterium]|nr:DUF1844 domain-containing protein [bacterium]
MQEEMKRDIKSIMLLLATQGMINLGEIPNPMTEEAHINLPGAEVFIQLLEELEVKTSGNLTPEETSFLKELLENLKKVYDKKLNAE